LKVVILAGGYGTRLGDETLKIPKPMIEIGGKPLVWHIMSHYAASGFKEFVIALGYRGDVIKGFFVDTCRLSADITVHLGSGEVVAQNSRADDWTIHLVDTGVDTMTGGRVKRLEPLLSDGTFMLTYGDGVGNVELSKLLELHRSQGRLATLTAVRPPARFGGIEFKGELVSRFIEKPQIGEGWINGGFMVLEPGVFEYLSGDTDVLEVTLLEKLAETRQLAAYRHSDFWQCMDTPRDRALLERLWERGSPPWKTWNRD
jgi:glucose-1-phosphate cytidylyltransferase